MKVYVYPADIYGCGCYRLIWPAQVLKAQGHDITIIAPTDSKRSIGGDLDTADDMRLVRLGQHPPDADLIVMQRVVLRQLAQAIPMIRDKGIAVVVDMDDDLTTIHPSNIAFTRLHPKNVDTRYYSWTNAEQACHAATMVTVSTPALLPVYGPRGRGRILFNRVPSRYLDIRHTDTDQVGWGGSVHSHPDDLHAVGAAVGRLIREGRAEFLSIGDPEGVRAALNLPAEPNTYGPVHIGEWPYALAHLGVGIAPLADTAFNRAKCLDAETRIATRRGLLRIADLEVGDTVWHDGGWRLVEATHPETPTTGLLLTTKSGRQLKLTTDHRLWRTDIWQPGWTTADQFRVGDGIALCPDELGAEQIQRAPFPADGRASRGVLDRNAFLTAADVPTIAITERWGRFLGIFAGDGCASGTSVNISCDGLDQDLIDLISDDLTQMGLWPSTQQGRMWGGGELIRRRSVSASSTHLIRFLRGLGVVTAEGVRRIVTVPEVIWRSPRPVVAAYLAGLFEADGTVTGPGVSLSTKHHDFALQIQRLLTAFGIPSTVREKWNAAVTGGPKFRSFLLSVGRAGTDRFFKDIGFLSDRKTKRLLEVVNKPHSNAYRPIEWNDVVVAIEPCWLQPVDIQVTGQVYAAAGFLSHNSWLKPLEMSACGVPWVASRRTEYERLHHDYGVGALADKPRDWYRALRALLDDAQLRADQTQAGRAAAAENTIEGNAWRWWEAWSDAVAVQRGRRTVTVIS